MLPDPRTLSELITNLQELEAVGGEMVLYSLHPKWRIGEGWLVDFEAQIIMPNEWKVTFG